MQVTTIRRIGRAVLLLPLALLAAELRDAHAYTPDSPRVQQLVKSAIAYLEKDPTNPPARALGGICLTGLAILKATDDPGHPRVRQAVDACKAAVPGIASEDNYSTGIAIIFLCELDPVAYRSEIVAILTSLQQRQRPDGAWSYPRHPTGDTSQTQYGVLGTWVATASGIETSFTQKSMEDACNWLMRTQDPSGAWSYQGIDPGNYDRVQQKQEDIRHSLCAAGLSSVYVSADVAGLIEPPQKRQTADEELPAALRRVVQPADRDRQASLRVNREILKRTIEDGNRWFQRNFVIDTNRWQHYYMYALERYMSFRERTEGTSEKEPQWYNAGVDFLARTQVEDGSWSSRETTTSPEVDTAFGVLFLLRSTQRIIARMEASEGLLIAGKELPTNLSMARLEGNQVVTTPVDADVQDLISILEEQEDPDIDPQAVADQLLEKQAASRSELAARLRELVSVKSYQARRVAVRALGKAGDLENVPLLIYALSDPDAMVRHEADSGLRFISRKLDRAALPDDPTPDQVREAQAFWKQWYKSVRPDADLKILE